ncbi:MAG: hypothetical protein ACYTED_20475 [Planctomycetota bacterium]|jgi:hypothetical protein
MPAQPTHTPELLERILAYARAGVAPSTAACACGVRPATWRAWLRRGREHDDENLVAFVADLEDARLAVKEDFEKTLFAAAAKDWRAALAILERQWPQEWAEKEELSVPDQVAPQHPCQGAGEKDRGHA